MFFTMHYDECGGYDCLTGAWLFSDADGYVFLKVDEAYFKDEKACEHIAMLIAQRLEE